MHSKTSGDGHFGRRSRPHKNMEQQRSQQRRRQRKEDVRLHVERLVKLWAEQFGIEAQVQQAIDIGQLKRNEDGSHDPSYVLVVEDASAYPDAAEPCEERPGTCSLRVGLDLMPWRRRGRTVTALVYWSMHGHDGVRQSDGYSQEVTWWRVAVDGMSTSVSGITRMRSRTTSIPPPDIVRASPSDIGDTGGNV